MNFLKNIYKNRYILWNLIKSDFKNRYLGNHFGIIWAFLQPLVMVSIYWFVFTYGFRTTPVENIAFLPWLLTGIIPWFFISEAIVNSSRSILDQSFLVKKIVFEIKLLPIVKIGSALLVNIAFWLLLIICLIFYNFYPNLMWLHILYYFVCSIMFVLSLSLLLSSIIVFIQDVGQIVNILMQIMFWATPIFWNQTILPKSFVWLIKLNPLAYIINGMRDALLYNKPFWLHYNVTLYFWSLVFILFYFGNKVFNKLRPHFADVL